MKTFLDYLQKMEFTSAQWSRLFDCTLALRRDRLIDTTEEIIFYVTDCRELEESNLSILKDPTCTHVLVLDKRYYDAAKDFPKLIHALRHEEFTLIELL